jgi:hypothetical protein
MRPPERIQLRRKAGWRIPANTVKVDRSTRWGNPFPANEHGQDGCVELFERFLAAGDRMYVKDSHIVTYPCDEEIRRQLGGKDVACWCGLEERCHGDVLMAIANRPAPAPALSPGAAQARSTKGKP